MLTWRVPASDSAGEEGVGPSPEPAGAGGGRVLALTEDPKVPAVGAVWLYAHSRALSCPPPLSNDRTYLKAMCALLKGAIWQVRVSVEGTVAEEGYPARGLALLLSKKAELIRQVCQKSPKNSQKIL